MQLSHAFNNLNFVCKNSNKLLSSSRYVISRGHNPINYHLSVMNQAKSNGVLEQDSYSSKIKQLKIQLAEAGMLLLLTLCSILHSFCYIFLGQAGLIAYGLLNMLYYGGVTLIAWIITSEKYASEKALSRLAKVSSTVWIGSQVTKAFRIGGAIFMAPFINKLMDRFQNYFKISSRNKTFAIMTSLIFGSMFVFYALLVLSASII